MLVSIIIESSAWVRDVYACVVRTSSSGSSLGPVIGNHGTVGTSLQGQVAYKVKLGLCVSAESVCNHYNQSSEMLKQGIQSSIPIFFLYSHRLIATTQRTPNFFTLVMW